MSEEQIISLSCYRKFEYIPIKDNNNRTIHNNIKIDDNFLNKDFKSKKELDEFIGVNFVTESKNKGLHCDFIKSMFRLTIMKKIDNIIKNTTAKFEPYFVVYNRKNYEIITLGVINETK